MKSTLKNKLFAILAGAFLSCVALPAIASAEICEKIDYTFNGKVLDQVQLYVGNSRILASDAACILKHLDFASYQQEVGAYLIPRLYDPQNIDLLINAVEFQSTKDALTQAGLEAQQNRPSHPAHHAPHPPMHHHMPAAAPRPPMPMHHPGAHHGHHGPRMNIAENVSQKIDFTFASKVLDQVKLYVGSGTYIYASDAADILKKVDFSRYQEEIGAYLCPKVADRDNIYLLINVPDFQSTKDALIKACSN